MSNADPAPVPAALHHYLLTVRPDTALHAWQARLVADDGSRIDFDAPIELLRHLAQLGNPSWAPARLK